MGTLKTRYEFEHAGGGAVKAELEQIGTAGQRAFEKVVAGAAKSPAHLRVVSAASKELQGRIESLSGSFSVLGAAGGPMGLVGIAAAAIATGLAAATKQAISATAAVQDLSAQAGVSTGAFQALAFTFNDVGVSGEELTSGLGAMTRQIGLLHTNQGKLYSTFKDTDRAFLAQVGAARNTEQALGLVADKIQGLTSDADRVAVASAFFGKTLGAKLVPALKDGAAGLANAADLARSFGAVLDADVIARADAADDALGRLSLTLSANMRHAFVELAPIVENLADGLIRLIQLARQVPGLRGLLSTEREKIATTLSRNEGDLRFLKEGRESGADFTVSDRAEAKKLKNERRFLQSRLTDLERQRQAALAGVDPTTGATGPTTGPQPAPADYTAPAGKKSGGAKKGADEAKRALEELKRLEADVATAGLEGLSLLEAKRDETYAKWAELARAGQLREEQIAAGNLAIWTAFDKDRTKLLADDAEKAAKAQETANEKAVRAQEKALEDQRRPWENFFENLQGGWGDLFTSVLEGGKFTGDALVDTFKKAGIRLIGELVSLQVQQAFVGPLLSALGLGGAGVVAPTGAITGGGSGTGAAGLLGQGTGALSALGVSPSSLLGGLGGGASLLASSGTTLGLLGLGLGAAQQGGGFKLNGISGGLLGLSAIRTALPFLVNNTALGAQLGGAAFNSLGSYGPTVAGVLGVNAASPALGGLAAGQIGPQTAGQAALQGGGGIASSLSSVLSVVGALYSLYSSVDSGIKTNAAFRQSTFGDAQANRNFTGLQVGLGAAGTVAGAGVGAVAGATAGAPLAPFTFGLSSVIGAVVGASIGAAIAQAVASSVSSSVGSGVSKGVRKGFTQKQLDDEVRNKLKENIILSILGGPANSLQAELFGGSFTPDVEDIFDKIGGRNIKTLTGGAFNPNRRLTVLGQGTTKAQRREIQPLLEDIEGLSALTRGLSGAGTGAGGERLTRLTAIIFNSLASFGKSTEQAAALINRAVRGFSHGNFFRAVQQEGVARALLGNGPGNAIVDVQDRAFGQALPGADLTTLRSVFQDENAAAGRIKRRDRKASAEAVQALLGDALGAGGSSTDVLSGLVGTVSNSVAGALGSALQKGAFGDLLSGTNRTIRRETRRALRTGEYDGLTEAVSQSVAGLSESLGALTPALDAFRNQILKITVEAQANSGDTAAAKASLDAALAPTTGVLKGYRQLALDVRSRSAFAAAPGGFAQDEAALSAAGERTRTAEASFRGSNPLFGLLLDHPEFLQSKVDKDYLGKNIDFASALPQFQEFADARLSQLEGELGLARKLQSAFGQVHQSAEGVLDAIAVSRGGRRAQRTLFTRDQQRFLEAARKENPSDPSSYAEVVARGQALLQFADSAFGGRSSQFRTARNLVEPALRGIDQVAQAEILAGASREKSALADVAAFKAQILPSLEAAQASAATKVADKIGELIALFEGNTGVIGILKAIANGERVGVPDRALKVPLDGASMARAGRKAA